MRTGRYYTPKQLIAALVWYSKQLTERSDYADTPFEKEELRSTANFWLGKAVVIARKHGLRRFMYRKILFGD